MSRDLHHAYQKLFKEHQGFPRFKSRKFPKQSYQCNAVNHNIKLVDQHHLKLPMLGRLRFKAVRQPVGQIKNVTIRLSATGKFYAIILVDTDIEPLSNTGKAIGIDMGVADLMITSDGIKYPTIRFDKQLSKKKRYWEKRLARRRHQAEKEIAWDKHNQVPEPRELADFKNYQKASTWSLNIMKRLPINGITICTTSPKELVEQYDVIKIKDLKAKNLMKNHKLARAIANQSWRKLRLMLEYKCAWYGKQLFIVNPRKTSQLCSACGYDDGKHTLDIRQWTCPNCRINHDRDINAAMNILKTTA